MQAVATSPNPSRVSRLVLARGLHMTYRQLDHACRRVPALDALANTGSGGWAQLTDAQVDDHRRMLTTVDRLLMAGLRDADLLDAACRATLLAEPGTEVVLWRSHRHGRWHALDGGNTSGTAVTIRVVVG